MGAVQSIGGGDLLFTTIGGKNREDRAKDTMFFHIVKSELIPDHPSGRARLLFLKEFNVNSMNREQFLAAVKAETLAVFVKGIGRVEISKAIKEGDPQTKYWGFTVLPNNRGPVLLNPQEFRAAFMDNKYFDTMIPHVKGYAHLFKPKSSCVIL